MSLKQEKLIASHRGISNHQFDIPCAPFRIGIDLAHTLNLKSNETLSKKVYIQAVV